MYAYQNKPCNSHVQSCMLLSFQQVPIIIMITSTEHAKHRIHLFKVTKFNASNTTVSILYYGKRKITTRERVNLFNQTRPS